MYSQPFLKRNPFSSIFFSLFITIFFLSLSGINLSAQCNRAADSLELIKLYNTLDGLNWKKDTNWLVPKKSIDTWYGVKLNSNGCVDQISLGGNLLKGEIYNFNFPSLQNLALFLNTLSGSIPNFDNLPNLKNLTLHNNMLTGQIPNFDNLPNLQQLSLAENMFSGTIPNFDNLPNLNSLGLGSSNFTGTIPNFDKLPSLKSIFIKGENLTGTIPNFDNLPNLRSLYITSTNCNGTVPNFDKLPTLEVLGIISTKLTGTIPNFDKVPQLQNLDLSNNQLIGTIPNFDKVSNLLDLNLSKNELTGTIPNFDKITKLKSLGLNDNKLTGTIPNFDKLPVLLSLRLGNNDLIGSIPDFDKLPKLTFLTIPNNKFTGNVPRLNNCMDLIVFGVNDNYFTFEQLLNYKNPRANYQYFPQRQFYSDTTINVIKNQDLVVNLKIDASLRNNKYTWIKVSDPTWTMDPSQNIHSNTYTFKNFQSHHAGTYMVNVTNDSLPLLTLESKLITLAISTDIDDQDALKYNAKSENLLCFANPVRDHIKCQVEGNIQSIHLIDMSGHKTDLSSAFKSFNETIDIDFTNTLPGIYFLNINTSEGWKKGKIVVID